MAAQYNNELSPHVLSSLTNALFSEADYASMDVEMVTVLTAQEEYIKSHPVIAIWRQATMGSLTRLGGTVTSASSEGQVMASDGNLVSFAMEGDIVTYPDGSCAQIITGSGSILHHDGKGFALVGSLLDNGDEIISTPQEHALLCCRAGEAMPEDFLSHVNVVSDRE
ncbi:PAAR domain-containing protein [Enterobacter kobei]|uniref:PAAR domain-containing protein n=1 Tax=Enterobacter kobei TaxID=208224 RepID=UPI003CF58B3E